MLERPSSCSTRGPSASTETGEQLAAGGDVFRRGGQFDAAEQSIPRRPAAEAARPVRPPGSGDFANLDFLADASAVVAEPDARTRTAWSS